MSNIITLHAVGTAIANISDQLANESELAITARDELIEELRQNQEAQLIQIEALVLQINANTQTAIGAISAVFTARADALNGVIEPQLQAAE